MRPTNIRISTHPRMLIRVFVARMKKLYMFDNPKCAQWRFWSDCANAKADLNLLWAIMFEDTFSDLMAKMNLMWIMWIINVWKIVQKFAFFWSSLLLNLKREKVYRLTCQKQRLRSACESAHLVRVTSFGGHQRLVRLHGFAVSADTLLDTFIAWLKEKAH